MTDIIFAFWWRKDFGAMEPHSEASKGNNPDAGKNFDAGQALTLGSPRSIINERGEKVEVRKLQTEKFAGASRWTQGGNEHYSLGNQNQNFTIAKKGNWDWVQSLGESGHPRCLKATKGASSWSGTRSQWIGNETLYFADCVESDERLRWYFDVVGGNYE
jgi:hypothetical protein